MNASQLPIKEKKKKNMPFPFLPPGETAAKIVKVIKPQKKQEGFANIWHVD
jgi:hypothetical protein